MVQARRIDAGKQLAGAQCGRRVTQNLTRISALIGTVHRVALERLLIRAVANAHDVGLGPSCVCAVPGGAPPPDPTDRG
jgi:hypothetical protein